MCTQPLERPLGIPVGGTHCAISSRSPGCNLCLSAAKRCQLSSTPRRNIPPPLPIHRWIIHTFNAKRCSPKSDAFKLFRAGSLRARCCCLSRRTNHFAGLYVCSAAGGNSGKGFRPPKPLMHRKRHPQPLGRPAPRAPLLQLLRAWRIRREAVGDHRWRPRWSPPSTQKTPRFQRQSQDRWGSPHCRCRWRRWSRWGGRPWVGLHQNGFCCCRRHPKTVCAWLHSH